MLLFMVRLGVGLGRGEQSSCGGRGCDEPGSRVLGLSISHERELETALSLLSLPSSEFSRALPKAGSMFVSNQSATESRLDLPPDPKMDLLCHLRRSS